jgi:hypothetical protein
MLQAQVESAAALLNLLLDGEALPSSRKILSTAMKWVMRS